MTAKAKYKYDGLFTARALRSTVDGLRRVQHKQICPVLQSRTQEAVATLKADSHHCKKGKLPTGILLERIIDIGKQAILYFEAWCAAEVGLASSKIRVATLLEDRKAANTHLDRMVDQKQVLKDAVDTEKARVYNAEKKLVATENARLNLVAKCEVLQALADVRKIQIASLETMLVQTLRFDEVFSSEDSIENMLELTAADKVLPQACDLLYEG